MKRLTLVLALIFAFTAAFAHLERTYARKFFDITGDARWIWAQHRMSNNGRWRSSPRAISRSPRTASTRASKCSAIPEYTVFINGHEIAGRRVDGDARAG
jgi:hypothetical protein